MVLFTKDVFLQIKSLTALYVQSVSAPQYPGNLPSPSNWQIYIQARNDGGAVPGGYDDSLSVSIMCETKEDAYRVYNDLMEQVKNSGLIPELNNEMFNEVLAKEQANE